MSEGEAARIAAEGNVSTVFATRRQERGTTCEYDWTWLLLPFDQWCAPTENGSTGAAFLAELSAAAGASRLVLYGEGGTEWYPRSTDFVRRGPAGAMDRVFEDGWDTVEQIHHAVSERGGVCEQAQIGQVWSI